MVLGSSLVHELSQSRKLHIASLVVRSSSRATFRFSLCGRAQRRAHHACKLVELKRLAQRRETLISDCRNIDVCVTCSQNYRQIRSEFASFLYDLQSVHTG